MRPVAAFHEFVPLTAGAAQRAPRSTALCMVTSAEHVSPKQGKFGAIRAHIRIADSAPFAFAIHWTIATSEEGLASCVFVSVAARSR
jgi:hypothetical protein